ncbi:MAG: prepilin-type N-terminal cleavage/methylation domain-containing protein [Candidatus Omnitrophota bacterium]
MKMQKLLGKKGFTLVEIMIVVAIIGLLAAIAIPNFVKARESAQKNACISNLKQIEGAMVLYNLDTGANPATLAALSPDYLKATPACPAKGTYDISGTRPTCSTAGHKLQ